MKKFLIISFIISILLILTVSAMILYGKHLALDQDTNKTLNVSYKQEQYQYKPIPKEKQAQYKAEIEKYIDEQESSVKKEIDQQVIDLREKYISIKNNSKISEQDIFNIDLTIEWFFTPKFNLYNNLVNITNQYVDIENNIPHTDDINLLIEFINPYFLSNDINQEALIRIDKYLKKKEIEANYYASEIHKLLK